MLPLNYKPMAAQVGHPLDILELLRVQKPA
jgi:hypothetical protein